MYRILLPVFLCAGLAVAASGQPTSIDVEYRSRDFQEPDLTLIGQVRDALDAEFTLRGIQVGESLARLTISARKFYSEDQELVALTVVEGYRLSDSVLDSAAEHEVWYAGKDVPEDAEDGAFVRQYMTREMLGNLTGISDIRILTFAASDLEMEISRYVDDYIERHSCTPGEACES